MFIQTEETPNPATMKFLPGRAVLASGTLEITTTEQAAKSPLAAALFAIEGVCAVFLTREFITVTKTDAKAWPVLKPAILTTIMDYLSRDQGVVAEGSSVDAGTADDNEAQADEGEVIKQIREILDIKIRPAVAQDGGDITFQKFEDGIVYLNLRGSCAGCPSSSATLKAGVENMLRHYIPEVKEVRQSR